MAYPLLETIQDPADVRRLSLEQLETLAGEIRQAICDQVAQTGGHLAPNLGVVELTLALHYVFDFSHDRLLFDVGHQSYPHKLITGRFGLLSRLRMKDGMAGFPEPRESPYDLFSCGHAGTAISSGVGLARAADLTGEPDRRVVSLVGDSSIVNGVAMEGLNNAGTLNRQFLAVLNDNGMSIGRPQGALAAYFDKIRINPHYKGFKNRAHEVLGRLPGGSALEQVYHRLGEMTKAAVSHEHMFDRFGLLCVGPVDGHDLPTLVEMFNEVKELEYPVLLHAKTVKGKGFDFSAGDPTKFHSPKPFKIEGCRVELQESSRAYTAAYVDAITDILSRDERTVAVTAGMPDGTGLAKVIPQFPERTFDVGIAESQATDMCAGMAKGGIRPFATIYSTFLQRAFDQVFQEVALQGLPVRFCLDRAGLVGGDGAIHHGFLDISYLRGFPGMVLMAPIDEPHLRAAMEFMRTRDDGPSAVRYPRDKVPTPVLGEEPPPFEMGKGTQLAEGTDIAILGYGAMAVKALEVRKTLEEEGYSVAVYDPRFAKPLDVEMIRSLVEAGMPILTVEDHAVIGGFGSCVLEACNDHGLPTDRIWRMGLPDRFIYQAGRGEQLAEAGLDVDSIARRVREIVDRAGEREAPANIRAKPPSAQIPQ